MLTEKKLEERRTGIGGSDAAAVCGLSRFKTPYKLYLEKIGEVDTSSFHEGNEKIHFGNLLEDIIASEYSRRTGNKVEILEDTIRHKDYPWMLANVDRIIKNNNGILECKTSDAYLSKLWGESYTDDFPIEYLLQCAHYAIVFDAAFVDLAVLIGGNNFKIYTYKRNPNLESKLIEKEKSFWNNHVIPQVAPDPITSEEASLVWSETIGEYKTANQELKEKLQELVGIKKEIDELSQKKDNLELLIKSELKEKDGLADEYGNVLLTWKNQQSRKFDIKSFQKTNPSLYEEFLKVSNSRVFRIRSLNDE